MLQDVLEFLPLSYEVSPAQKYVVDVVPGSLLTTYQLREDHHILQTDAKLSLTDNRLQSILTLRQTTTITIAETSTKLTVDVESTWSDRSAAILNLFASLFRMKDHVSVSSCSVEVGPCLESTIKEERAAQSRSLTMPQLEKQFGN